MHRDSSFVRSTTAACRGFVYAASTMGVTGTRATVSDAAEQLVDRADVLIAGIEAKTRSVKSR